MYPLLQKRRGVTLTEALVVIGLSSVIMGLLLNTFIGTQRESDRLTNGELMHQEALLISQSIERVLRYRVSPTEIEGAIAGGAGPAEAAAGGGVTTGTSSNLPSSIAAFSSTTLLPTSTPRPAVSAPTTTSLRAPVAESTASPENGPSALRQEFTSAPASIQSILGTTSSASIQRPGNLAASQPTNSTATLASNMAPAASAPRQVLGQERFVADEVVVYSLSTGSDPSRVVCALRNSRGLGQIASQAYMEQSAAAGAFAPGSRRRALGPNSDKFQSQVSFRFANSFEGSQARWMHDAREVPRLLEYTIRVWPIGTADSFDEAQQKRGRSAGFQYTSAIAL